MTTTLRITMILVTDADPGHVLDLAQEAAARLSEECDGTMDEDTISEHVCVSEYEPAEGETPPRAFGVSLDVSNERIESMLCCAFEGGSGYWCHIERYENPDRASVATKHLELPLTTRGAVICRSHIGGRFRQIREEVQARQGRVDAAGNITHDGPELRLDRAAIDRGLQLMAKDWPNRWSNVMSENDDADDGDCFLQLCLLGEIVYG